MATNTTGSANRYTSRKIEVDGITLYDSDARFRKNFLKKHLKNTVDVVRFSYMMGKLAVKPVIGPLIRKSLELHYRYIHTNSVVVPIEVAKDIIRNTTDIAVSPCVCRTVRQNCDQPINTCMGLNFYGAMKKKAGDMMSFRDSSNRPSTIRSRQERMESVTSVYFFPPFTRSTSKV